MEPQDLIRPNALVVYDSHYQESQANLKSVIADYTAVQPRFYWRSDVNDVDKRVLRADGFVRLLEGNVETLNKDLPAIDDLVSLSQRMEKLIELEKETLLHERNVTRVEMLRMKRYLFAIPKLHEAVMRVKGVIESGGNLTEKIGLLKEHARWGILSVCHEVPENPFLQLRDQALEMLDIFDMGCTALQKEVERVVDQEEKKAKNTLLAEVKTALSECRNQVAAPELFEKPALEGDVPQHVQEAFTRYIGVKHGFQFWWDRTSWRSWAGSLVGYHKEQGARGKALETVHAPRSKGSHEELEAMLFQVLKGEEVHHLEQHRSIVATLQRDLNVARREVYTATPDAITTPLVNSLNGFDFELIEQRGMIDLIASLLTPQAFSVLKAHAAFRACILPRMPYPIPTLDSLENAMRYFIAGERLSHIKELPEETIAYCKQKADTLAKLFKKHALVAIQCTDGEQAVWSHVVTKGTVDGLYYEFEDKEGLPSVLKACLTKCVTHVLYLPVKKSDIGKLELLMHEVKKLPEFATSYEGSPQFKKVIDCYNDKFVDATRNQSLERAKEVALFLMHEAEGKPFNVLTLARIWQRSIEFAASEQEPRYLTEFLLSKVRSYEKKQEPLFLYDGFREVVNWNTKDEAGVDTLLAQMNVAVSEVRGQFPTLEVKEIKNLLLQSFLLRALSASLYSSDQREQELYQGHVQDVLELEIYREFRGDFSPHLERLIAENTVFKAVRARPVGINEQTLFKEGPLTRYIRQMEHVDGEAKVSDALFARLQREGALLESERTLTNFCLSLYEPSEHKAFLKVFRVYLTSMLPKGASSSSEKAARKVAVFTKGLVRAK